MARLRPVSAPLQNEFAIGREFLDAIEFAIKFAGSDRILAGSDYPHQIGSIPKMLDSLSKVDVTAEEKEMILGGNAVRLLRLKPR